jgi:8-oxo-dGTP pyrophosphatase MutT (NUDIX family)
MTIQLFRQALTPADVDCLQALMDGSVAPSPVDACRFFMGTEPIGWLQAQHVPALQGALPGVSSAPGVVRWDAQHLSPAQRSQALALAAQRLREQGLIRGWRDECYSHWGAISHDPDPALPEWFRLERSAFRFFGLRSHAVHINGFTPDGRMWCARRALSKATDPGRLDNLAAGGLAAGEGILLCAVRELYEEAGIVPSLAHQVQRAGRITTARSEVEGWHDETLLVFNLLLPDGVVPHNTDGEVSGFECLSPAEVMARIRMADFSEDAACVVAQGVLSAQYFSGTTMSDGTGERM